MSPSGRMWPVRPRRWTRLPQPPSSPTPLPPSVGWAKLLIFLVAGVLIVAVLLGALYVGLIGSAGKNTSLTQYPKSSIPDTSNLALREQSSGQEKADAPAASMTASPNAWTVYADEENGYKFAYPKELTVWQLGPHELWVGEQIQLSITSTDPTNCRGDCPLIELQNEVRIGKLIGKELIGYVGAVGGTTPQSYRTVVVSQDGRYFAWTVYELPRTAIRPPNAPMGRISQDKNDLLDRIVGTLAFI